MCTVTARLLGMLAITSMSGLVACSRSPATFESPEQAATAFVDGIGKDDARRLRKILGKEGDAIIGSGDPVADSIERSRFLELYAEGHQLVRTENVAYLQVGQDDWLMPLPIVKRERGWTFDPLIGEQEIVARRIGRNELATILVSLAYVDAQYEYATRPRENAGVLEYAQRILSSKGKHDGLYWPAADDQPQSPMGPLIAAAQLEGYGSKDTNTQAKRSGDERPPYHGYYYKVLKAQGANAVDGAYDYLVGDRMIGGFALLAYPANYGNSGVMSFVVNHRGVVYEKDLGTDTEQHASSIERFDPDSSWRPVAEELVTSLDL